MAVISFGPQNEEILGFTWDHLPLNVQFVRNPGVTDARWSAVAGGAALPMVFWNICMSFGHAGFPWTFGPDMLVDTPLTEAPDIIVELIAEGDVDREAQLDVCVRLDPATGFAKRCKITLDDPILADDTLFPDPMYCRVVHGLGHAMGIGHTSIPFDLMNPDCTTAIPLPSDVNVAAVGVTFGWYDLSGPPAAGPPSLPLFRNVQVLGAPAEVYGLYPCTCTLVEGSDFVRSGMTVSTVKIENNVGDPVALASGTRVYDRSLDEGISTNAISLPLRTDAAGEDTQGIQLPATPDTFALKIHVSPVSVSGASVEVPALEVTYEYDVIHTLRRTTTGNWCGER